MGTKKDNASSYNAGKKNEKDSEHYYNSLGYVKVTGAQRKIIALAYEKHFGIDPIKMGRGYDLITAQDAEEINNGKINSIINDMVLVELKTAGKKRRRPLKENFNGMGFTASSAEQYLANALGEDKYKVLLVDLKMEEHLLTTMQNILSKARCYPTLSVFISEPLI